MSTRLSSANGAHAKPPFEVVIIGGGIAGLSAGWYLQKLAAEHGLRLQYTILETSSRWGGKIQTETVMSGDNLFRLESGPDAFLTRKPWALALAKELGLSERIEGVRSDNQRTFVLHHGRLTPLPKGLQLLVPTQLMPFLQSPLFSLRGKIRMGLERFIPMRTSDADETLANFVRRRLGVEALDKLADPLLAGVYNSEPERQSILATFPQFPALEKRYGSLLRGMQATRTDAQPDNTPPFISFQTGTHELVDALVKQLTGTLQTDVTVQTIEANGADYRLTLSDGATLRADAIILAIPARGAADLLKTAAPKASAELSAIRYASVGMMYLGYHAADVQHPLAGFGVVIPGSEKRPIDGMTWMSSKWHQAAPANHVLLRVFFGGPRTPSMMHENDADLLRIIRKEVRMMLGIQAAPLFNHIVRWHDAYPQYDLGHLERVAAIEATLPAGITVTGSSYRGVGVPDCVKQGETAAKRVVETIMNGVSATPHLTPP